MSEMHFVISPLVSAIVGLVSIVKDTECSAQDRVSQATANKLPELQWELGKKYFREGALGTVSRELYIPYPRPNASSVIVADYEDPRKGLRRYEVLFYQIHDDVYQDPEIRRSDDNGKTWTDWEPSAPNDFVFNGTYSHQRFSPLGPVPGCYDPASEMIVQPYTLATFESDPRRIGLKGLNHHTFVRVSRDNGKSWDPETMMRFEQGSALDPRDMRNPKFMQANQAWYYFNIIRMKNGALLFPCATYAKVEKDGKTETFSGVRCFIGKWNKQADAYDWKSSAELYLPKDITGYLEEPWVAELKNGDILIDLRGTNDRTPGRAAGRHWRAVSKDNGLTWSEVKDWRYDNGEQFLSPATMGKMLRHSKTGKLYWFGNISKTPPVGNSPRYPLYIAEIDESNVSIKKATLTVIDDFDPERHISAVQFSNFFVFENRETSEFEVYLSPYGQYANVYQASVYKFVIKLKSE